MASNFTTREEAMRKIAKLMATKENVEFKTMDGLTLRGWFFPADVKGPGIVMTPGVGYPSNPDISA